MSNRKPRLHTSTTYFLISPKPALSTFTVGQFICSVEDSQDPLKISTQQYVLLVPSPNCVRTHPFSFPGILALTWTKHLCLLQDAAANPEGLTSPFLARGASPQEEPEQSSHDSTLMESLSVPSSQQLPVRSVWEPGVLGGPLQLLPATPSPSVLW